MNYKQSILNGLLDKYEKSKSFQEDSKRRILLKRNVIKEYNIEQYEEKKEFHDVVKELKEKNIIDYSWERFEEGNILKEIWLIKENIEKAYSEIGRSDKKQEALEIIEELKKYSPTEDWIQDYCQDMAKYCQINQKPHNLLPYSYRKDILKVLSNLNPQQEILKRVFSIKCFGDSKYFENEIEHYLIRITKKYLLSEYEQDIMEEEVLQQIGIVKAPEIIEFCGNLTGTIEGRQVSYAKITKGSYINSFSIRKLENLKIQNATKILLIENKTNYIDYIMNQQKQDEFVIYHGGMYSPVKGMFFQKIYDACKEMQFYHWSDIDIGGFKIFTRLKTEIIPTLQPYAMGKKELLEMKNYWKPISLDYKKELEKMAQTDKYATFKDCINFMIRQECRLEQESFMMGMETNNHVGTQ